MTLLADSTRMLLKIQRYLTSPPTLPRFRQPPRRLGEEGAPGHVYPSVESYFRKQYFEVIDLLVNELKRRFTQKRGLPIACTLKKVLIGAANRTQVDLEDLPDELKLYKEEINLEKLKIQLQMLPDLVRTRNATIPNCIPIKKVTNVWTLCDIFNEVTVTKEMFSEVLKLVKIFYTIPVTTSTAERSFSALRRLKTYLRSTMSQPRLNNLMLLYTHKERTDAINLANIAKTFVLQNDRRRAFFGHVIVLCHFLINYLFLPC